MSQHSTKMQHELASVRDTVESIWVAIVLAFVLRAFVVEAFVIPTGSMAPRLYGEHIDLTCPACGYEFAYGWSAGQEQRAREMALGDGRIPTSAQRKPAGATCPTCGYDMMPEEVVSGGDRVLVMKYLYRFQPPKPWDVVVFKNSQDNSENYIKRLIGLPGETIEIVHGDIFYRPKGKSEFRIRRKQDPKVQDAMWQVVFDNDFRPKPGLFEDLNSHRTESSRIYPPEWRPADPNSPDDAKWDVAHDANSQYGRVLRFAGADGQRQGELALTFQDKDRMFLPRYGYDGEIQSNWMTDIVSDLKLEGVWYPSGPASRLVLSLSSFEYVFRGEITGDGEVHLLCRPTEGPGSEKWRLLAPPAKVASLADGRGHVVSIRNVDLSASVWIDGRQAAASVDAGDPTTDGVMAYPMDYKWLKNRLASARQTSDAKPIPNPVVRIAAGGPPSRLQHVKLMRDVYYTSPTIRDAPGSDPRDAFARRLGVQRNSPGWGTEGNPITLETFDNPDLDQYFVMGDNSPSSLDGRLWIKAAPTLKLYDETGLRGDPNLAIGDIGWPSFLQSLQRPTAGDRSSAAAYIRSRLSLGVWEQIRRLTRSEVQNEHSVEDSLKRQIVAELNGMIDSRNLFDPKLWLSWGVTLGDPARGLADMRAAGQELAPAQLRRLNRLAIQAAMPEPIIRRQWRIYQLGTVPGYSLIGKAIFVYWPSGFLVPGLSRLPVIPNVGRMRLIR
jgi:signal peptidase I